MQGAKDRRRDRPPACGPYARPVWDAAAGRWHRRLTDEGRAVAEDYLRRYPKPALVLWNLAPRLMRESLRAHGEEAVHAAAAHGIVSAVATYDPAYGTTLVTHATFHIRAAVQVAFTRKRVGEPARFERIDAGGGDGDGDDRPDGFHPAAPERAAGWDKADWGAALRGLTSRGRRVLLMRYAAGMTLGEIGAALGLSKERVRQIQAAALVKIRADRPDLELLLPGAKP